MLQDNPIWQTLTARLHIIVATLATMLFTVFLAVAVGNGEMNQVAVASMAIVAIGLVLMLGDKYWLLIPFSYSTGLPAFPIGGRLLELPEIVGVLCTFTFILRLALKRQKFAIFRREHAPVLLYAGWVAFIFLLHPVSFSALGSSGVGLGGARFYAKIILALASFLVMANQNLKEKDCKIIIILTLIGSALNTIYQISLYFIPSLFGMYVDMNVDPDSFYTWHQMLATVPILLISLAFSRYKTSELLSSNRLWMPVGLFLCVILIALSGKRALLASIPQIAILAALLRREWGLFLLSLVAVLFGSAVIILGHGEMFHLPLTVQRAFSALPAQWDPEIGSMEGGIDPFRAELRRQAVLKIEEHPWVGEGYQIDLSLAVALSNQYVTRGGDIELQCAPFALGSAWHNTWLGYAADFGIPLSVIVALLYYSMIRNSYFLARTLPHGTMRSTLAVYLFITITLIALRTHTSGHSATDPFSFWWYFGVIISLIFSQRQEATTHPPLELSQGLTPQPPFGGTNPPRRLFPMHRPEGPAPVPLISRPPRH